MQLLLTMSPSSIDNMSAVADPSKLSKSQKKRRKRKAAKEGSVSSNSNNEPTKPVEPAVATAPKKASSTTLNPSAKVHDRLMAEGYTAKEVETAMGEMWDKEMTGYDEFDAVLAYLRGAHKENETTSTAPSTTMDDSYLNGNHQEQATEEEKEDASISTASSQHLDMAARLDMVADSEDLGDSAFALNKWILEMAKQNEVSTGYS